MSVRRIEIRERVMEKNDAMARDVRARLESRGVLALNLVSSPGSGKTLLLERTLRDLGDELRMAVVTGDVQTQNDADRIARWTDDLVQAVVTGGACHLDARQVTDALGALDLDALDVLFIENVGNLVCPAIYDLGQAANVVALSVTEGEDKPLKYPTMFHAADLVLITKIDLLPHLPGIKVDTIVANLARVMPTLRVIPLSAVTGEGMEAWRDWLRQHERHAVAAGT